MKKYLVMAVAAVFTLGAVATQAKADGHEVKFGFAAAETGWLQAYSGPSTSAALINCPSRTKKIALPTPNVGAIAVIDNI